MNEGLALMGVLASHALSHSALPGAPVVPDERRERRRSIAARVRVARVLHRAAEALERPALQASTC